MWSEICRPNRSRQCFWLGANNANPRRQAEVPPAFYPAHNLIVTPPKTLRERPRAICGCCRASWADAKPPPLPPKLDERELMDWPETDLTGFGFVRMDVASLSYKEISY